MHELKKQINWKLAASLLLPALVLGIIFFACDIYPFGVNTIVHGDMNNQYIQLFSFLKQNITKPSHLMYTSSMTLGGNFYGVLTYYLMNPLNIFVFFFSIKDIPIFLEILTVAKVSFSSMAMYIFLSKSKLIGFKNVTSDYSFVKLALSLSYALMIYVFNYKECIMWLDGIILLPLITLGLEKIVIENKWRLYIITLSAAIITNYYFGVMIGVSQCVFLLGYCIINFKAINQMNFFKIIKSFFLSNITVFMLTAWVTIPSLLSTSSVTQSHVFSFKPVYKFYFLLSSFFNGRLSDNVPALYMGIFPIILIMLFILSKKVDFKSKCIVISSLLALLMTTWIDITYLIWHVFTWPNGFPQREAFIVVFYFLSTAAYAFVKLTSVLHENNHKLYIASWLMLNGAFLILYKFKLIDLGQLFLLVLFSTCFLLILDILLNDKKAVVIPIILFIVTLDVGINGWSVQETQTASSIHLENYSRVVDSISGTINSIKLKDKSFYRIGQTIQTSDNDTFLFDYNGVSGYLSQINTEITKLLSLFGYYQNHGADRWANYNNGSTKSMDSFLGIKYIITSHNPKINSDISMINEHMGSKNQIVEKNQNKKISIVENNSYFPLAISIFGNDKYKVNDYSDLNPFELQNLLFKSLSNSSANVFVNQHVKLVNKKEFSLIANDSGEGYIYFPTIQQLSYKHLYIYVNNKRISAAFGHVDDNGQFENGIISIGKLSEGEKYSIVIKYKSPNTFESELNELPLAVIERDDIFSKIRAKLVNPKIKMKKVDAGNVIIKTTGSYVRGKVMLTLPYEKGWDASVDGENVKIIKIANDFMAVNIAGGSHTIKFRYHVPGLRIGILITLLFSLSLSALVGLKKINLAHKNKDG